MRTFKVTVNGTAYDVTIEEIGTPGAFVPTAAYAPAAAPAPVAAAPAPLAAAPAPVAAAPAPAAAPAAPKSVKGTAIKSPFPGTLLRLNVKEGDSVKTGDVLCVVEAMKMENDICSPCDGKITAIMASEGRNLITDEIILSIG